MSAWYEDAGLALKEFFCSGLGVLDASRRNDADLALEEFCNELGVLDVSTKKDTSMAPTEFFWDELGVPVVSSIVRCIIGGDFELLPGNVHTEAMRLRGNSPLQALTGVS